VGSRSTLIIESLGTAKHAGRLMAGLSRVSPSPGRPPKGRDLLTERLKDGFDLLHADGDMPEETEENS